MVVDKVAADTESSGNLSGVNQIASHLSRAQQVGNPGRYCLNVGFAKCHCYLRSQI
jgi:hypothetical protein